MPSISHQRGVGLVEVLIALLVLGLGMLALGRLMATAVREIEIGRVSGLAVQLASEKFEDLRSFTQLDSGAPGVFGFDEIGDSSGGAEAADGRLLLPAGVVDVDGQRFTRDWSVRFPPQCGGMSSAQGGICLPSNRHPDLIFVAVSLKWVGLDGRDSELVIENAIAGIEPALSPHALLRAEPVAPP